MKKLLDVLRFILISPEMAIGLVVFFSLVDFPDMAKFVSSYIFNQDMDLEDYVKLLGLPVTALVLTYKFGDSILNPEEKENREKLKQWPKYWMLKNRIYYSLTVSVLSLLGSLGSWYYALNINLINGTILLLIFWSVSLACFATVSLAKLSIKDILY